MNYGSCFEEAPTREEEQSSTQATNLVVQPAWNQQIQALFVESAREAMIACDIENRILFWNRGAQEIYGWSAAEVAGQNIHALLHTSQSGKIGLSEYMLSELMTDRNWQGKLFQRTREGKRVVVESRQRIVQAIAGLPTTILHINSDVTHQHQTEIQLEEQVKLLATAGEIGFWSWNIAENRSTGSMPISLFHEDGLENMTYEQFLALTHPDDRVGIQEAARLAIEKQQPYNVEFRIVHPRQGIFWFASYGRALYDEEGEPSHLLGVVLNITKQKRIEDELKKANMRANTILESITDYFMFLDTEWRYAYVSPQVCQLVGKSEEELIGKCIWDVYPELVGTDLEYNYYRAMETQQPISFETLFGPLNLWFAARLYPTPDGLAVYSLDISQRRQMEQALRASEAKFRTLVEADLNPIIVGSTHGQIFEANDAYLNLIGYTREELVTGKIDWQSITSPEYRVRDEQAAEELARTGVCRPYEKACITKSGRRVPFLFGGAMLENTDDHFIGFLVDLTAQKELEKQREQFLSMVSHELRTPLTGIRGSVQLAQRRLKRMFLNQEATNPVKLEGRKDPTSILDNALYQTGVLDRLISDLIESARVTEGRIKIVLEDCDLVPLVQEVVESQQIAQPEREIRLEIDNRKQALVNVDADRIGQVLANYLTNALKYAPADKPIVVGITGEEQYYKVWVRDQGPGLSPEARQRIWERFYRAPGVEDRSGSGVNLGLGLYVCRKLIELHHGDVGVESALGEGSTFWFTLPCRGLCNGGSKK